MSNLRRLDRDEIVSFAEYLDTLEPEQFAPYEGCCDLCGTPFYGILDEGKLICPIGYVAKRVRKSRAPLYGVRTDVGLQVNFGLNIYESIQFIVKTGLFTREQLRGFPFNQHELEVNDRSFMHVRPKRCDCSFGSPNLTDLELGILAEFSDPVDVRPLAGADLDLISGRPVRTGFRRRSKDAIKARRLKKREKDRVVGDFFESLTRTVIPVPKGKPLGYLTTVNPIKVELTFGPGAVYCLTKRQKGPKKDQQRIRKCEKYHRKVVIRSRPSGPLNKKKYWYFYRNRGYYRPSLHHHR